MRGSGGQVLQLPEANRDSGGGDFTAFSKKNAFLGIVFVCNVW